MPAFGRAGYESAAWWVQGGEGTARGVGRRVGQPRVGVVLLLLLLALFEVVPVGLVGGVLGLVVVVVLELLRGPKGLLLLAAAMLLSEGTGGCCVGGTWPAFLP